MSSSCHVTSDKELRSVSLLNSGLASSAPDVQRVLAQLTEGVYVPLSFVIISQESCRLPPPSPHQFLGLVRDKGGGVFCWEANWLTMNT